MEGLIVLVAFMILAAVVVSPILAIIALRRSREVATLKKDLERLETQYSALVRRVYTLEQATPGKAPAEPVAEKPLPAQPSTPPIPVASPLPEAPRAPAAAPAPPLPPQRPPVPPGPTIKVDWERWIGLRGAAALGGIVLALAALLFFQISIEKGWITPALRVILGIATGIACLVGSEWMRARGYRITGEGVGGAGVVILYAAFWSAYAMFSMIGLATAFIFMVLVTVACCLMAIRHSSQFVAVLGLVGGFATPLLLSSGSDRPIGLFGYILLLDLGLLTVGVRRRWPSLGLLSLLGTFLLESLWIGAKMGPERLWLGLIIVGLFAALFAVSGRFIDVKERGRWLLSRVGAVLLPFAFALYFASRADLGPRLYPLAILLVLLSAAACWVGREQLTHMLPIGAAVGSTAVVGVWIAQRALTTALAWEVTAVALALALVYHAFVEWEPDTGIAEGPSPPAIAAVLTSFGLLILAAPMSTGVPLWPWLVGWTALAVLLYRQAGFPDRAVLQIAATLGIGLGLTLYHMARHADVVFPGPALFIGLLAVVCVVAQGATFLRRERDVWRFAEYAAATLPLILLAGLIASPVTRTLPVFAGIGGALLLGILAVLSATRVGSGLLYMASATLTLLVHAVWVGSYSGLLQDPNLSLVALALLAFSVIFFTLWPFVLKARFVKDRWAWYAAALAAPAWFFPLRQLFEARFGDGFIGLLPLVLGVLSLWAAFRSREVWSQTDPMRKSALVWFSAVALCFISIAIPLQLEKEWITIGWALEGLAVIALWRRLDHPGLKYFGLGLLGGATARLVANPELFGYYPRSGLRIVNWLLYTYIVPAGALLWSTLLLYPVEVERKRDWENPIYSYGKPVGASLAGLACIVVVFVWINLTIADWYGTATHLTWSVERAPARDVTVSVAWGLYALVLLGLGMARSVVALRWISLALLLFTIGKVFLYDLGELEDLYRVASLVGLSVSLLLVSLLYQRFVFRRTSSEGS